LGGAAAGDAGGNIAIAYEDEWGHGGSGLG
jgi:hypothetical protein